MKGDDHRKGSSPYDLSLKRKTPDGGLSSSNRLHDDSTPSSSFNGSTPGVWSMKASPIAPACSHWQRDTTCYPGRIVLILETALGGDVPQVDEPWIRTRLLTEVRNAMGLQGRGGTIQYHELLAIGEGIGNVSTGYSEEVIMAKMVQWKFSFSTSVPRVAWEPGTKQLDYQITEQMKK